MLKNIPPAQPLRTILIRRRAGTSTRIPTSILVPSIRHNRLVGSDEISADGKRWIRLDRHPQLAGYFQETTSGHSLNEKPAPVYPDPRDAGKSPTGTPDRSDDIHPLSCETIPVRFEKELSRLASMLEDLNE